MTTEEQLRILQGKLESLQASFEELLPQLNELFEAGYNACIEEQEDPDSEEAADAAAVWDYTFDSSSSPAEAIDAINAALGEEE